MPDFTHTVASCEPLPDASTQIGPNVWELYISPPNATGLAVLHLYGPGHRNPRRHYSLGWNTRQRNPQHRFVWINDLKRDAPLALAWLQTYLKPRPPHA